MRFELTPEEARPIARVMIRWLKKQDMKVRVEKAAWDGAPYRTTIVAERGGRHLLIEAQGGVAYGRSLRELVSWLEARRMYAELYIATTIDAHLTAGTLKEMKDDGVGLFVVDDAGGIAEQHRARNPALVVTPDPTIKLGTLKAEVGAAVLKFNSGERKDGLRDMCEVVERLCEDVGVTACRRGWLKVPEAQFKAKDWSGQINELARPEVYNAPHVPLISSSLKDDLHSFRGARNLVDHPARSRRDEAKRQRQFAERMVQGPRLSAELLAIRRTIR